MTVSYDNLMPQEQQLLRAIWNAHADGMAMVDGSDIYLLNLVELGLVERFRSQAVHTAARALTCAVFRITEKGDGVLHNTSSDSKTVHSYVTVPEGVYKVRIAEVRPGTTRAGDERWSLRLVVAEGEHAGKQAAWDSLVFSTRGHARARLVFLAFNCVPANFPTFQPADLEGLEAWAEIRRAEYTTPNGAIVARNEVPYDGYRDQEFTL